MTTSPHTCHESIVASYAVDDGALDAAPFHVVMLDASSHAILRANDLAHGVLSRLAEGRDYLGLAFELIGSQTSARWLKGDLDSVAESGISNHASHAEFEFRDGVRRHYDWSVLPLRGPDGTIERLLVISSDVTEPVLAWEAAAAIRRVRDLESLNEVARAIHSADWNSRLATIASELQRVRPCGFLGIFDYNAETQAVSLLHGTGDAPCVLAAGPLPARGTGLERAAREHRTVSVPDVIAARSEYGEEFARAGYGSMLLVPMVAGGQAQGILVLLRAAPHAFTDEDVAFYEQVATHGAVALRKAALYSEHAAMLDRQRRLMEIGSALGCRIELDTVLRMIQAAVLGPGGFERAAIFLYDVSSVEMVGAVYGPGAEGYPARWPLRLDEVDGPLGDTARMLQSDKRYLLREDYGSLVAPGHPMAAVRHHAEIAMRVQGRVVGMISVDNPYSGRPIRPEDIDPLLPFCDQAAAAVHTAMILRERDDARQDAERRLRREQFVNSVSRACASTLDPDEVVCRVMEEVRKLGDVHRIEISRPAGDQGVWRVAAAWNRVEADGWPVVGQTYQWPHDQFEMSRPLGASVRYYRVGRVEVCRPLAELHAEHGPLSLLRVELWMEDKLFGLLHLLRLGIDAFTEDDVAILEALAPSVALALHNADLHRSLKQAQEALVRAETLRAVGELASGVAHNINNLLAAVLGYAELIQSESEDPEAVLRDARIIEKAAIDGAEIVGRVQRFARQSGGDKRTPVDLAAVLEEALDLTRARWHSETIGRGRKVEVIKELTPDLLVDGHASELKEVFVNLIRNACDAMDNGGTLTVRSRAQRSDVVVEVRDTGVGMDETTRRRIFEPFFTTKGVERGLGLGLSVSWGLVDRHGGRIDVESAPGSGTTFRVRLPRRHERTEAVRARSVPRLSGSVLLVEDEEPVRDAIARGLALVGLTVETANDADDALVLLGRETASRIEVVICDHGMAGMTGLEMLAEIRRRYPGIRRILLSGWGANMPGDVDASAAERILSKPVTAAVLTDAIRELQIAKAA